MNHDTTAAADPRRAAVPRRTRSRLLIERTGLMARLDAASQRRCVVIDAPAGYGKTSLLLAWQRQLVGSGTDVGWLALAPGMHAAACVQALLGAFASVDRSISTQAREEAMGGLQPDGLERVVIALVHGLAAHGRPMVLVVDDAQHGTDPGVRQIFQLLLEYAPSSLRLALATRGGMLPLTLARERAQGQVLDLDREALRFSRAETALFLAERLLQVDAHQANMLHELSEGWAMPLQLLSAQCRQRRAAAAKLADGLHEADERIAAFFDQQVLAGFDSAQLRTLESWAGAAALSVSLCSAIAAPSVSVGSVATDLARFQSAGLLSPAGPQAGDGWWRMNPLARGLLRSRFVSRSVEERQRVHMSAWHWFALRNLHHEATRHALLAGDLQSAAQMADRGARLLFAKGDIRALVALVRQLPPELREAHAALRLWLAWIALCERRFEDCERVIAQVEAEHGGDPVMHYRLTLLRSLSAVLRDDTAAAVVHLDELLHPPAGADAIAVAGRRNVLSWLFLHLGEHERARTIQQEGAAPLLDGEPIVGTIFGSLVGRTMVGMSHAVQGDMREAEEHYRAVLAEAGDRGNCMEAVSLAQQLLVDVSYERHGPGEASRMFAGHGPSEQPLIPDATVRIALVISRSHVLAGQLQQAHKVLDGALEQARRLKLDRAEAYLLLDRLKIHLAADEPEAAHICLRRLDALGDRHAQSSAGTHGDVPAVAERVQVRMAIHEGRLVEARERLVILVGRTRERRLGRRLAYLLVQSAGVARSLGDRPASQAFMQEALALAHRLGLMQTLLDAHPQAPRLLREAAGQPGLDARLAFHVERIEAMAARQHRAADGPPGWGAAAAGDESLLTPREAEVVALLRQGMPNKRIARALGLSLDTVKWHLKNVYLKLGVHGRDDVAPRLGAVATG
ncbi:LuxR C-terminal-related transcriptional regulator [Variovorax sp. OV329]|uniref:LuxR C-terminal-related transcriptional regulator n=1 Tax=Variovorax sp. OV329 TaxID=1882825 RepID=UPI0008E1A469|nr:LuxR C-terminal-related transcriptional regulator [Variovorax sp. OV329]SFM73184.1 LuxR family transcriptional regulator, maltose regulon positive regulatory protein [Variovorax sp. OV329]